MLQYSPTRVSTCYNKEGQQEELLIANLLHGTLNSRQLSHINRRTGQRQVSFLCINQVTKLVNRPTNFIFRGILKKKINTKSHFMLKSWSEYGLAFTYVCLVLKSSNPSNQKIKIDESLKYWVSASVTCIQTWALPLDIVLLSPRCPNFTDFHSEHWRQCWSCSPDDSGHWALGKTRASTLQCCSVRLSQSLSPFFLKWFDLENKANNTFAVFLYIISLLFPCLVPPRKTTLPANSWI